MPPVHANAERILLLRARRFSRAGPCLTVRLLAVLLFVSSVALAQQEHDIEKHYNAGLAFFEKRQLESAAQEFSAVIKLAPQMPQPYFFLGKIYAAENVPAKAEQSLLEAVRLKPDFPEAYNALGVLYLEQRVFDKAQEAFTRTVRLQPDYAPAYLNLGTVYLNENKVQEATEQFTKARALAPADKRVAFIADFNLAELYSGHADYRSALPFLEEARSLNPEHVPVLLSLCDLYFKLKRTADADSLQKKLSSLAVQDPSLHLRLGLMLAENDQFSDAALELGQAQKDSSPSFELLNSLGTAYYRLTRYAEAVQTLKEAITLRPDSAQAYLALGESYLALNDPQASEVLLKCVQLDPARDNAWELLSRELARRKAYDQAIEILTRYAEMSPQKPLAHLLLGEAYYNKASFNPALEEFKKAAELAPQLGRANYYVGLTYKMIGQYDEAKKYLTVALNIDPKNAVVNAQMGDLLFKQGDFDAALGFLRKAVKLIPDMEQSYVDLGEIYVKKKQWPEALAVLKKAIELCPECAPPHYILGMTYRALKKPELAQAEYATFQKMSKPSNDQTPNQAR